MPSQYHKVHLLKLVSPPVTIRKTSDEYIPALQFRGFAFDSEIKKDINKPEQALKQNNVAYYGNFRFLGYDASYKLLGRKNEIIASVNRN